MPPGALKLSEHGGCLLKQRSGRNDGTWLPPEPSHVREKQTSGVSSCILAFSVTCMQQNPRTEPTTRPYAQRACFQERLRKP